MADLIVIVPSRGRPEAARALIQAFKETCTADTFLMFTIDDDDPALQEYRRVLDEAQAAGQEAGMATAAAQDMVQSLNSGAVMLVDEFTKKPPFAIGFMGDDHRPRTVGWDSAYLDALRELGTGIVYGDDLLQGENLPTQCAMTADIIRELGYMAPLTLRHMYVDNFWLDLGRQADCLYYLPDVVIEHMHPIAGKAEWDEGHKRVNAREIYDADAQAYAEYHRSGQFWADVDKVKALVA